MTHSTKHIIEQALELPASERAIIADQLLLSLDQPDLKMDELWAKEAEARIDAYERGEIKAISIHEVFGKYDTK
jgi:putative addiction module component (TIGR02574 family)